MIAPVALELLKFQRNKSFALTLVNQHVKNPNVSKDS